MTALRILVLAAALVSAAGAWAWPASAPPPAGGLPLEDVQVVCGPYRCFARPFWRYRSGAGFRPYGGPGFLPPRRFGFAPFGFRRFGGFGRPGGPGFR